MWRVGSSPGEKAVGASTNARKITPPSQTTSDKSMRNRRNDMSEIIELSGLIFRVSIPAAERPRKVSVGEPVIHSPNQRGHLLLCAQLFTLILLPHCLEGNHSNAAFADGHRRE